MTCTCLPPDSLLGCGTRAQAAALYADARRRCPEHGMTRNTILQGDVRERLRELPDESVHCVVTSPPYWSLRDYGVPGQLGLEATPEEYVANMVAVFREVRRVLRRDGVCWLNLGDCYAANGGYGEGGNHLRPGRSYQQRNYGQRHRPTTGLKPKDLVGIPWRCALALQADGWWLRSALPWVKRASMPESVTDRPSTALEYVFLLTRSERYYADMDAVRKQLVKGAAGSRFDTGKTGARDGGDRTQSGYRDNDDGRGRNFRNADLWWESVDAPHGLVGVDEELVGLDVNTQPFSEAHFATFPERLVLPLVKMGTSEYGCCAECGAPWRRVVERGLTAHDGETASAYAKGTTAHRLALLRQAARQRGSEYVNESRTTGWEPTCKHDAPAVPALVLDPFFGSGTTGLAAAKAGRDWLGIELNPDYVRLAEQRLIHVKARLL